MKTMQALTAVVILLAAGAFAGSVTPVYQCINPVDPYCYYFWAVLNCNSANVTAAWSVVDANGAVVGPAESGTRTYTPGWNTGAVQGICAGEYDSGPFPWTARVTYNGVTTTSSIPNANYNPNGVQDCWASGPYNTALTCGPSTTAPATTTPPPTTLPPCPYACNPV